MDEQITIKQHYVPVLYLKNFSMIKGKAKKEKYLTSFYLINRNEVKENIPVKSILYKDYFYGESGTTEKFLANKESQWARIINGLITDTSKELDTDSTRLLKEFLIYQYFRTPEINNDVKKVSTDFLDSLNLENDYNSIAELDKAKNAIEDMFTPEYMVKKAESFVKEIDDLKMTVVQYETSNRLITSDTPVICINKFNREGTGLASPGLNLILPLSPKHLLVVYDSKMYQHNEFLMNSSDENEVDALNHLQVLSAGEMLISKNSDIFESLISNKSLMQRRIDLMSKCNVNTSLDMQGKLHVISKKEISIDYPFSFCKLPSYIKKIPKDSRRMVTRSYNETEIITLLTVIYGSNKLKDVGNRVTEKEKSKFLKDQKQMLQFLYEYHNVPITERTISAEKMKELKNKSLKFFPCI